MAPMFLPTANPLANNANPFATRRVRPGAMAFIFPDTFSAKILLKRLDKNHGWGQIVGPHGSGKSTLLASLISQIKADGRQALHIVLHDRQRHLPLEFLNSILQSAAELSGSLRVFVDGYEQLGRWSQFRLKRLCRRCQCGLVVTAHQPVGLPMLHRTDPSLQTAYRVVEHLQRGHATPGDSAEIALCYARQKGNMREMLFDLYDLHEKQRSCHESSRYDFSSDLHSHRLFAS